MSACLRLALRTTLVAVWLLSSSGSAAWAQPQDSVWTPLAQVPTLRAGAEPWVRPAAFRAARLNAAALRAALDRMPRERPGTPYVGGRSVEFPMPDGTLARFQFVESPVMAPELAARFPEIRTYLGVGLDDPAASARFDLTPAGFHAQILSPQGAVYIDPLWRNDVTEYASYYRRDFSKEADGWRCYRGWLEDGSGGMGSEAVPAVQRPIAGATLRTYRLAVAATGEYTAFHGGTVAAGLAAIVTAINRVNGIYEQEFAVRLVLVPNNDLVVYTNPTTDPYSNADPNALLGENQATLDSVLGNANYDLGHVFGTGGGGLAYLGVVCSRWYKARGETGSPAPTGDPYYVDYVAHEIGHQFGADHTFNGATGYCSGGNRNAATAYEPGSGSTIMAYAGICGADNLQTQSDPWFHFSSQTAILAYVEGSGATCAVVTATGNHAPAVEAGPNYMIPKGTPFTLTATGSDADGHLLTFCWEERDLGPAQALSAADNGSSPLFRSFPPTTSPSRVFPKLAALLSNTTSLGEKLPALGRTLRFRVTARDNQAGGGGVSYDDLDLTVDGNSGPFEVTAPNAAVDWSGAQTVTWAVAGTAGAPLNTATVTILLSTDGGNSFPTVLAANTPNDGSETVVLPPLNSTTARVKVQADGNIFFDVSNEDFTLTPPPDYLVTTSGHAIVVTDLTGVGNTLTLSELSAEHLQFAAAGRTFSVDGGAPLSEDSGPLSRNGVTHITINAGAGADTLHLDAFSDPLPSLKLQGGPGDDTVHFHGDLTFLGDANLDVDLQNDDPTPAADRVRVAADANLTVSGSGTITVKCWQDVALESASSLASEAGDITLVSDGMDLNGGTITTGPSARVSLRPFTAGWRTDVGTTSDALANTLGLSDAELDRVSTGTLVIGDAAGGGITASAALSPAGVGTLELISGDTIADTDVVGTDVTIADLTIDGDLAPGASPGQFNVEGDVTLAPHSTFTVEIGGTAPGTEHDQLSATGSVDLGADVRLNAVSIDGFTPQPGDAFTLIARAGGTGTFVGLAEGAVVTVGGVNLRISYVGGNGADVALRLPQPTAAALAYFRTVGLAQGGVEMTWGTLVEAQTLGFHLERAGVNGDWERVTPHLIPALGSDARPRTYGFTDPSAPLHHGARYRLIAVDWRGRATVTAEAITPLPQPSNPPIPQDPWETVMAETPLSATTIVSMKRTMTGVNLYVRSRPKGTVVVETAISVTGRWSEIARIPLDESGAATMVLEAEPCEQVRFYRVCANCEDPFRK